MPALLTPITLVIPTYHNRAGLARLLRSVAGQNWQKEKLEVIVVDDRSGEDLTKTIKGFQDRLNVKLIVSEVKGRPGARNTGAKSAKSDLLIFIDDDMELSYDYLREFTAAHQSRPDAVLVGRIEPALAKDSLWNILHDARFESQQKKAAENPADLPYTCLFTGSLLVPRMFFEKIGRFDQITFSHYGGEDFDFGLRCRDAGIKLGYAEKARAIHKQNKVGFNQYLKKAIWEAKSLAGFLAKHRALLANESVRWEFLGEMPGFEVKLSTPGKQAIKRILSLPFISAALVFGAKPLWIFGLKAAALQLGIFGTKYFSLGYFDKELRLQLMSPVRAYKNND